MTLTHWLNGNALKRTYGVHASKSIILKNEFLVKVLSRFTIKISWQTFLYLTAFALDLILHDSAALHWSLAGCLQNSNTTLIKTPRELEDQQQKNLTDL